MDSLVERLEHCSQNTRDEYLHELTGRAAARITALEAGNARLRAMAALVAKILPSAAGLNDDPHSKIIACYLSMGELRAARQALADMEQADAD